MKSQIIRLTESMAYSIGIIGGADGPTAIFVTAPLWTRFLLPAVLTVLGIGGLLWLRRRRKKKSGGAEEVQ